MIPIAYSYLRFSSKKQAKGSSFYRQTEDTIAGESPESWCRRNSVTLDTSLTFRDLGRSAFRGEKQEALKTFLEYVKTGRIRPGSYLLVERVDRITRKGLDEGSDLLKAILKAGITIVTLGNGRVYGPGAVKGLMKGWLELQMYLEAAHEYSEALSKRVSAAWEVMHKKAREKGILVSAKMPPWLRAVGEGDERRAVPIPEKVAVVQRVFDLLIAGKGVTRIVRTLTKDGTPPLTRGQGWSTTTVRRLLRDRALLGEHQPRTGRHKESKKVGDTIEGYYPAIISEATFGRAAALLGSRKRRTAGRESEVLNVFTGLLKDARNPGLSYQAFLRIENGRRHHVLMPPVTARTRVSFPFEPFERAILGELREIEPKDLLPPKDGEDEVLTLSGEVAAVEARIAELEAELEEGPVASVARVLRKLEVRKDELNAQLAEARLRSASPLSESWGEARSLLDVISSAPDPTEAKVRLRGVLRRIVKSIWMLVVPRGRTRLAIVQAFFTGGGVREWLVIYRPVRTNGISRQPARLYVDSARESELELLGQSPEDRWLYDLYDPELDPELNPKVKEWVRSTGSELAESYLMKFPQRHIESALARGVGPEKSGLYVYPLEDGLGS